MDVTVRTVTAITLTTGNGKSTNTFAMVEGVLSASPIRKDGAPSSRLITPSTRCRTATRKDAEAGAGTQQGPIRQEICRRLNLVTVSSFCLFYLLLLLSR